VTGITVAYTRGMDLLIGCMVVTGIVVLAGFVYGLRALALSKTHPEASSLRLMALNLLEPGVTMLVLFVVFVVIGGEMDLKGGAIFVVPAIAVVPLTWMLLAPLWTQITHPLRGALITYGLLRWLNTVAFWYFGIRALTESQSNDLATLAAGLIVSGTLILCLSVTHLASSLSDFRQLRPTHS
jgi:hypothetical protein